MLKINTDIYLNPRTLIKYQNKENGIMQLQLVADTPKLIAAFNMFNA